MIDSIETGVDAGGVLVGPGVELAGLGERQNPTLPALVDIDISNSKILISLLIDQPAAFEEVLVFADVMDNLPPITNVSVNSLTNWAGFTPVRLGGTSSEIIFVALSQLAGLAGQQIVLDVIPEPATAGLALIPIAACAARRRVPLLARPAV